MAEESDNPKTGGVGHGDALDPVAMSIALGAAAGNERVAAKAEEFLGEQSRLTRLQAMELSHELRLRHWSLRVRHISDVMKLTFEIAVGLMVVTIVTVIASAIWKASHDNSLVIEAFSVPPDMSERGLTGQAVSAKLQDKLSAMQDGSVSLRPAASYANNWGGDDIKVQIPDTGVSAGDLYRLLVAWLGHQTHITGEVYRTANGIAITARAGGASGATVTGSETDIDGLVQNAAEAIYEQTQPYRYAIYEAIHGNDQKMVAILRALSVKGETANDRGWAYIGLSVYSRVNGNIYGSLEYEHKSLALVPGSSVAYLDLDEDSYVLGDDEAALSAARNAFRLLEDGSDTDIVDRARAVNISGEKANADFYLGDFNAALREQDNAIHAAESDTDAESGREGVVLCLAGLHEHGAARDALRSLPPSGPAFLYNRTVLAFQAAYKTGDWGTVLSPLWPETLRNKYADARKFAGLVTYIPSIYGARQERAYVARAMAAEGHVPAALNLVARTPLDCDECLRIRGKIDALAGNWDGAAFWFADAVKQAPSIPFAYADWGEMLMAKGDLDDAIAKFQIANQKGPHFADPLEMWGEALMRTNRSDLALGKFQEANKYAPNWGRLHLEWGEALHYAGMPDEAGKQFAIAAGLDLSQSDKAALLRWRNAHG
jgi:tetratricopeptide (TPR) repeat protein